MKEERNQKGKTVTLTFESALEAHAWGSNGDKSKCGDYLPSQRTNQSWSGTATFEDSVELAAKGWTAGTSAILDMVKRIEAKDDVAQRGYEWDVTGDFFDVGEVIQGTPECWLAPAFEPAPRVISICVNIGQSSSVSAEQIINRGAALIALIDRIQDAQGIIVELTACVTLAAAKIKGMGYGDIHIMFPVGSSPLPMQEVGFILAHPSMIRRGCFAVAERLAGYRPENGIARAGNLPGSEQENYSLYLGTSEFSNGISECNTVDGAVAWIHKQMDKMGL